VVPSARRAKKRRLIIPVLLAVTTATTALALTSTQVGCGDDDGPRTDAGVGDGQPDTPII